MSLDHPHHRDVDRGWAWVVLAACMCGQIITGIVGSSVGLFKAEFLSHFGGSNSFVSLIASIYISLQLTMGPVAGFLCNVFGIRAAMMTGAVLLSAGLFLTSFASNLPYILGMYSLIAGAGFGITYTPLNVILGHYFHKRRALANGLSVAACGIGFGPGASLVVWIIESQGWRFALSVLASIGLQKAVIGSVYFPLKKRTLHCLSSKRGSAETEEDGSTKIKTDRSTKYRIQSWLWFLRHPHWWILCVSYGISMMGFAIHVVHFPSYALAIGVSKTELVNLVAVFGIVMSLGRALAGFLCNDSSVDLLTVMFATQGLYGMSMLFMPLYAKTYLGLMVYQVIMSLFYGTSMVPITPYSVQLFGLNKLASVFGWIMMWGGVGYIIGPVIAGFLYDLTSSYSNGFYVGGFTVVFSSLLLLFIPLTKDKVSNLESPDNVQRLLHDDKTISVRNPTDVMLD